LIKQFGNVPLVFKGASSTLAVLRI